MLSPSKTLAQPTIIGSELEIAASNSPVWKKENRWSRFYRERYELNSKYVNLILSHDGGFGDYDWIIALHRNEYEFLKLCYSDLFQLN